jgi:hypothetical protein
LKGYNTACATISADLQFSQKAFQPATILPAINAGKVALEAAVSPYSRAGVQSEKGFFGGI